MIESYSRILESLAFTVLSRIDDVLHADYIAQNPNQATCKSNPSKEDTTPRYDVETTAPLTLSDLLTWSMDQNDSEEKRDSTDDSSKEADAKHMQKLNVATNKKTSYLESLGGLRSPTARH